MREQGGMGKIVKPDSDLSRECDLNRKCDLSRKPDLERKWMLQRMMTRGVVRSRIVGTR
jgi:hypothetical protein